MNIRETMEKSREYVERHVGHRVQAQGSSKDGIFVRYVQKEKLNIGNRLQGFSEEFWIKYDDDIFPQPEYMIKSCLTCQGENMTQ